MEALNTLVIFGKTVKEKIELELLEANHKLKEEIRSLEKKKNEEISALERKCIDLFKKINILNEKVSKLELENKLFTLSDSKEENNKEDL